MTNVCAPAVGLDIMKPEIRLRPRGSNRILPLLLAYALPPWILLSGWLQERADIGVVGIIGGAFTLTHLGWHAGQWLGAEWQKNEPGDALIEPLLAGLLGASVGFANGAFLGFVLAVSLFDAGVLG